MARLKPRKIGIVIKQKVPEANDLALGLAKHLHDKGATVFFASESHDVCTAALGKECSTKEDLVLRCDLILVLGGDGTFLSVARLMYERSIPIIGVNMGTLGFITEVKKDEIRTMLDDVLRGNFTVSERVLLESWVVRNGEELGRTAIVNDVVISKSAIARIFEMELLINSAWTTTIKADGIIVSTPTGSTAYSLAAGGPIIEPSVPALVMTPICPHSLTLRPLVVDDKSRISIDIPNPGSAVVTFDGQASLPLEKGDVVHVEKLTRHTLQVVQAPNRSYFGLLREKLKYGYRD